MKNLVSIDDSRERVALALDQVAAEVRQGKWGSIAFVVVGADGNTVIQYEAVTGQARPITTLGGLRMLEQLVMREVDVGPEDDDEEEPG